jgi:26S proteasome regulatory subunit N6
MSAMEVDQTGDAGNAMDVDEVSDQKFDELLDKAKDLETTSPDNAVQAYKDMIFNRPDIEDPNGRGREKAIYALGSFFVKKEQKEALSKLSMELRPVFIELPKAKTAKIVRSLIDSLSLIPGSLRLQIEMCQSTIEWCKEGKRSFLRQRIETRLAALYLEEQKYQEALSLLAGLLSEVKKAGRQAAFGRNLSHRVPHPPRG